MTTDANMPINPPQGELPPFKVAFIINNEIVDVLHTDDRLSAIFLSNPVMVDVTDIYATAPEKLVNGSVYNPETKTFTTPAI